VASTLRRTDGVRWAAAVASIAASLLGCGGTASSDGQDAVTPCGGELTGEWINVNQHVTTPPNPNVDACWNLMGSYSGGIYSAYSRYPTPERRVSWLSFQMSGSYTFAQIRSGPVTVTYAADCLVTDQGTPTCGELQAALLVSGTGEGSYHDTVCTDQAGGGCTCVVQVTEVGGPAGTWQTDAATKTATLTKPTPTLEPAQTTVGYCVDASGLRFDRAIDSASPPFWPDMSGITLTPRDCGGSVQQLKDRYGPDCALVCDTVMCGGSLK
jgi:hypothetical protein